MRPVGRGAGSCAASRSGERGSAASRGGDEQDSRCFMARARTVAGKISFEKAALLAQAEAMPLLARAPRPLALDLTPVEVRGALPASAGARLFRHGARGRRTPGSFRSSPRARSRSCAADSDADWARLRARSRPRRAPGAACRRRAAGGFAAGCVEYDGAFCFGSTKTRSSSATRTSSWHELGDLCGGTAPASRRRAAAPSPALQPRRSPASSFARMVARAQEYIAAGDIYQVNLAHRFTAPWQGDAVRFLRGAAPLLARAARRVSRTRRTRDPFRLARVVSENVRPRHPHAPDQRHAPAPRRCRTPTRNPPTICSPRRRKSPSWS